MTRYHFDSTDDVPPIGQWLVTTGVGHPAPSVSHTGEVLRDDSARTPVVHERVGGLTYAASEAHAVARGGRLLTLAEARQHMGGKALCPGDDQWCAVAGRDWVQIGDRHHHPGKSHVVDCHHYPPWGDDANNATYGRPTWNAYALYATSGGGGGLDGAWFSFKNGDEANVHDRFEAREAGGRLYRFTRGGAPLDNYAIEGAQLVGGVPSIGTVVPAALFFLYDNLRATVAPGGDILWSHGYTSRREGAPAAERTVGAVVASEVAPPPQAAPPLGVVVPPEGALPLGVVVATAAVIPGDGVIRGHVCAPPEAGPLPLVQTCDLLRRELGLAEGSVPDVLARACQQLGVAPEGTLLERAARCRAVLVGGA